MSINNSHLRIMCFSFFPGRYLRWSDFVKSKESRASSPYFSYCILLICTLFLVISFGLNGWAFEPFSTNPSFGPSPEVLMKMGAKHSNSIVNSNEIWRLLTPMILRELVAQPMH